MEAECACEDIAKSEPLRQQSCIRPKQTRLSPTARHARAPQSCATNSGITDSIEESRMSERAAQPATKSRRSLQRRSNLLADANQKEDVDPSLGQKAKQKRTRQAPRKKKPKAPCSTQFR